MTRTRIYGVNGFLDGHDPKGDDLPLTAPQFDPWWQLSRHIGEELIAGTFHAHAEALSVWKKSFRGVSDPTLWRLFVSVSFLVQAYVWGSTDFPKVPRTRLPAGLAVLAYKLGKHFGVRPLLIYATYALYNWRLIDVTKPVSPENVTMLVHFNAPKGAPGGEPCSAFMAEDWFVAIHIAIEDQARHVLLSMEHAEASRVAGNIDALVMHLRTMTQSLREMTRILSRMSEHCTPEVYFRHVRPYLFGFTQRLIPEGVVYEGVKEYNEIPQYFDGQTGAQSSIMPALDRFLGISHTSPSLSDHLERMLRYHTPLAHRQYVRAWGAQSRRSPRLDWFDVLECHHTVVATQLMCLRHAMADFRAAHYMLAITHIARPAHAQLGITRPTGTGGSDLIPSLLCHLEETLHPSMRSTMMKHYSNQFQTALGRPLQ